MKRTLTLLAMGLNAFLLPVATLGALPPMNDTTHNVQPSLSPMLKQVMPSVVNIFAQGQIVAPQNPFNEPAASRGKEDGDSNEDDGNGYVKKFETFGSGVIVDANNGYIITNAHVIAQARSITVTLNDGRRYHAGVRGVDLASDIAVLQIKAPHLNTIPFGDSNQLEVGDFVVAIGSPFGLNQTVTSGIVSALQRDDLQIEGYEDFIQTDAPINPGNSGGALVNLKGEFVGMNTAILAPNGGNVGIGFAIPADMVKNVMTQLIEYGTIGRGIAGFMIQTLTPELAKAFNVDPNLKGAVVTSVRPSSPADAAGLKPGDIIEKINGQMVERAGQVKNTIGLVRAGSEIHLSLLRNNQSTQVSLKTASPAAYKKQSESSNPFLYGVVMRNFDAEVPNFGHVQGVQILNATDSSPAWQAGLRTGDVIVSANMKPVHNMEQLKTAVNDKQSDLLINILRGSGSAFFVVSR